MKPVVVYPFVYVLELEGGKWYCGATTNLNYRWAQHVCGDGAKWTRLWKPVRIAEVHLGDEILEREITARLCEQHGKENVRGGTHTRVSYEGEA